METERKMSEEKEEKFDADERAIYQTLTFICPECNEPISKDVKSPGGIACKNCGFYSDLKSIPTKTEFFEYDFHADDKLNRKVSCWCNECHRKVKTRTNNCPKCNSTDLDGIKKKPEVKFYFSRMEGWYLLPSLWVGRIRFPEAVAANTFSIGLTFLCFDFFIEFWWNIADVKRIKSVEDVLEMSLKIDSAKFEADSATNTDWDQMIKSEHAKIQEAIEKEK